jgi:uncharacterized coiled-coil protein SlyX
MAGSNEGAGVKIALIICIMLMITFMVTTYLYFQEQDKLKLEAATANTKATDSDNLSKNYLEQIDNMKKVIGHLMSEVGNSADDQEKTHVIGAMNDDIKTYGGELAQLTYSATIVELRKQLNNVVKEREQLQKELEKERNVLLATQGQYIQQATQHDRNRTDAAKDLQTRIGDFEKRVNERDNQITQANRTVSESQLELDRQREIVVQTEKKYAGQIKDYKKVNDILRDDLDTIRNYTFEVPDGTIRWVDNSTHLAWINLGSEDSLPRQMTFSVYAKNNSGVARQDKGIKGSLEVTRILGPHLSEARILRVTDVGNPIVPEDVVYSPLWQKGRVEYFSFVGEIDFDGDGLSDRELLHDLVESAGAKIDNEVDDQGVLTGNGISLETKFLVIGKFPDPAGQPPESKEAERIGKMIKYRSEMIDQARTQAVRRINLTDFLNYVGYTPKQRLYLPGQGGSGQQLRSGATSQSVNEYVGNRDSSGTVSGVFSEKDKKGVDYTK